MVIKEPCTLPPVARDINQQSLSIDCRSEFQGTIFLRWHKGRVSSEIMKLSSGTLEKNLEYTRILSWQSFAGILPGISGFHPPVFMHCCIAGSGSIAIYHGGTNLENTPVTRSPVSDRSPARTGNATMRRAPVITP